MGEVCGFAGGEQGACYARLCWHRGRGVWPSWASGAWCMVLTIVASVLSPLVRTVHLYVGRSVVLERLEACRTRVLSVIQNRHIPSHPRLRLVDSAALVITQRRPAHGIALQQHASTRAVRTTRELLPCSTRTKRGTQPCTRMLRPEESIGLHACDAVCVLVTLWRGSAKVVWRCVCFMRHAVCLGRCVTARVCQIRATAQSR
mmetsp:Transcript_10015/g.25869  ORF Transcript_10015/g.25869 Transcript_10015/m.25869 type:complete len:203 (-) Transcript_10015:171-779(-)